MKMPTLPKMKMPKLPKLPKPQPKRLQATARRAAQPAVDDYDEEPTTRLSSAFVVVLILHVVAVGGIYAFNSIKAHRRGQDVVAAPTPSATVKPAAETASQPTEPVEKAVGVSPAPQLAAAPVAQPQPPATSVAPISGNRIYHVRSGDTLWRIASIYNVSIEDLAAANGLSLDSKLQLNRALNIPATSGDAKTTTAEPRKSDVASTRKMESSVKAATPTKASTAAKSAKAATPAKVTADSSSSKTHTVKKGENPVAIAKKLGVSYDELLKLNKISDPRKIPVGRVLKVPAKKGN